MAKVYLDSRHTYTSIEQAASIFLVYSKVLLTVAQFRYINVVFFLEFECCFIILLLVLFLFLQNVCSNEKSNQWKSINKYSSRKWKKTPSSLIYISTFQFGELQTHRRFIVMYDFLYKQCIRIWYTYGSILYGLYLYKRT